MENYARMFEAIARARYLPSLLTGRAIGPRLHLYPRLDGVSPYQIAIAAIFGRATLCGAAKQELALRVGRPSLALPIYHRSGYPLG